MLRENAVNTFAYAVVSLVGREARNCPFRVRVCSLPPSQSKPCQERLYLPDAVGEKTDKD